MVMVDVVTFFGAYIILLWLNFFSDFHPLGSKYLIKE